MLGTLYLVGTPIGNLEDMTFRAVRVLNEVDVVAAEDTRHSGRLLKHYGVHTRLISFHGDSPESRLEELLRALESGDVALISDAGMPAVSDPGADLVRAAVARGIGVEVVPGPSAITAAVALSGLVDGGFLFAGYPPRRKRERKAYLARLAQADVPAVLFESPHRLLATLDDFAGEWPEVDVAVCRELTKMHEEVVRGSATDVRDHFQRHSPRGEFVLVIGRTNRGDQPDATDRESLAREILAREIPVSAAARELARVGEMPRSEAYALLLRVRDESSEGDSESGH